jgi:hypothetical protein
MSTGYQSEIGGVLLDFDDLFDPYVMGTPPPPIGYSVLEVDLAGRYAPLSFGEQGPDTGYTFETSPGVFADLATLWAAKGTANYVAADLGLPGLIASIRTSTSGVTSTATFSLLRNGTTSWSPPNGATGAWATGGGAGIGDNYEVIFDVLSSTGGGTLSGSATGVWLALSMARGLTRSITRTTSGSSEASSDIRARVRPIGSVTVLATHELTLSVTADVT